MRTIKAKVVFGAALTAVAAGAEEIRVMPGADALVRAQEEVRAMRTSRPDACCRVVLSPGEYRLSDALRFGAEDSGSPKAPVVWCAEDGAVIRGGVDVGPWTDEGGGVVSAAIPLDADERPLSVHMLCVNGVRPSRSVLPRKRGTGKCPVC